MLLVLAAVLRIAYAYTPPVGKLLNSRRINQDIASDRCTACHSGPGTRTTGCCGFFKVEGLIGLYWSPPYLHDRSIAVGRGART